MKNDFIANSYSRIAGFQTLFKPLLLKKPTPTTRSASALSKSLLALALIFSGYSNTASALAFDSNIAISGSTHLHSDGALTEPTNASQSGTLTSIVTGSTITTTLNGGTISGSDPLSGTLSDIGDGFGIGFNASGASVPSGEGNENPTALRPLFGELELTIQNNSAIDSFLVSLQVDFSQAVDASGADAFAQTEILLELANNIQEMSSKIVSDTLFGNQEFASTDGNTNAAEGTFGGPLSDNNVLTLVYWLDPGDVVNLGSDSHEVTLLGNAFKGSFSASTEVLVTVGSVEKVQEQPLPEPGTLLLLAIGIISVGYANRHRTGLSYK
jgi:hypothetical protein